jgi:hypothetical protein
LAVQWLLAKAANSRFRPKGEVQIPRRDATDRTVNVPTSCVAAKHFSRTLLVEFEVRPVMTSEPKSLRGEEAVVP